MPSRKAPAEPHPRPSFFVIFRSFRPPPPGSTGPPIQNPGSRGSGAPGSLASEFPSSGLTVETRRNTRPVPFRPLPLLSATTGAGGASGRVPAKPRGREAGRGRPCSASPRLCGPPSKSLNREAGKSGKGSQLLPSRSPRSSCSCLPFMPPAACSPARTPPRPTTQISLPQRRREIQPPFFRHLPFLSATSGSGPASGRVPAQPRGREDGRGALSQRLRVSVVPARSRRRPPASPPARQPDQRSAD